MSSSTSLLGRAARLLITPAPTTFSESSAILKHLQTFGGLETFLNTRSRTIAQQHADRYSYRYPLTNSLRRRRVDTTEDPTFGSESQATTFLAIFETADSLTSALKAGPLVIETGLDASDPKEEDPYNVRGLRDRKSPPRTTFKCEITPDTNADRRHAEVVRSNNRYGPFEIDTTAPTFRDIQDSGAPVDGMAAISTTSLPLPVPSSAVANIQNITPLTLYHEAQRCRPGNIPPADPNSGQDLIIRRRQKRAYTRWRRRLEWLEHKERLLLQVRGKQARNHIALMEELREMRLAEEAEKEDTASEDGMETWKPMG